MESGSQLNLYATAHNQGATVSLHYCFLCHGTLCYALVNNQQISIENLLLVFLCKMIQDFGWNNLQNTYHHLTQVKQADQSQLGLYQYFPDKENT